MLFMSIYKSGFVQFYQSLCKSAYGKAGNGNEMKSGNGNWKRKLGEFGTKTHQSLVQCFLHGLKSSVFCHYSCILLSNGYMNGFMSHVLCLYSCTVLCDYLFSVID